MVLRRTGQGGEGLRLGRDARGGCGFCARGIRAELVGGCV